MAYNFPEGAKFLFSPLSTFATAKTIASITNADPGVCSSVAHGYVDNDELLVMSNWEDADQTIFRADMLSADTFSLLDFDTSDTNFFSPGGGAGSTAQKVGTWLEIPQVLTIDFQGGDVKNSAVNPLSRRNGLSIPTGFNPTNITLSIGHDPSNTTFKQMLKISRSLKKVGFKLQLITGAVSYGFGYMNTSEAPRMAGGQVNQVPVAFAIQGRMISYG